MSELATYQPPSTELAVTTADPTGGRLVAWAKAASAANSLAKALTQTTFVPKGMQNVGDATAAILAGDEVGLSPLAALRSIYVIHGTPAFYARTMVALALSHGHEIWTTESTDQKVTIQGRRKGGDHVETVTWTLDRARKAGYTNNSKYSTNAQEMLYSKAAAEVARKIAPDVLSGMAHSVEDIELSEPATTTVTRSGPKKVSRKQSAPEPVAPEFDAEPPVEPEPQPEQDAAPADEPDMITSPQTKKLGALMREVGLTDRAAALSWVAAEIGREISSRNELTKVEASGVIDALERQVAAEQPAADEWPETAGGAS